jgi:hypothetical protein
VTITNNIDKARQESKAHVAFYITNMGDFYREQLVRLGYEETVQTVRKAWEEGGRTAGTAAVPDAFVDSLHLAGPVEACLERLAAQAEAGVDLHTVHVHTASTQEATAILARLANA